MSKNPLILLCYLLLDVMWISVNFNTYNEAVISVQKKGIQFRLVPAFIAYCLLILNIYFILIPFTKYIKTMSSRVILFSLSGLVIYGVYNATTYAIIENYPLRVALIDTAWGMVSHTLLGLLIEITK